MSLTHPTDVKRLLRELGVAPRKALGQNFLIDRNILNILLDAAELQPGEAVFEVGPGLGVVTCELVARGHPVRAVEKDRGFAAHLTKCFADRDNVDICRADALDVDLRTLPEQGYRKVVANLPYNVGSRILMELGLGDAPDLVAVTVQREVADRLVADPGSKGFGILGLWMQSIFSAELVKVVNRTCFLPPPAVQSAIVRLRRRERPLLPPGPEREAFHLLTRYAFMHRRKQLAALLAHSVAGPARSSDQWRAELESSGIAPQARPENVSPGQWVSLLNGPLSGAALHPALCAPTLQSQGEEGSDRETRK